MMKSTRLIRQGEKLLIQGNFEVALGILTDALVADPNNPEVYYLLGDTLCKLSRFEDAITMLHKANKMLSNHPRIVHLLGWALFMNGDIDSGRKLMERSLETDAENEQIYADLAVLELKELNFDQAQYYIQLGKTVAPDDEALNRLQNVVEIFKQRYENRKVN